MMIRTRPAEPDEPAEAPAVPAPGADALDAIAADLGAIEGEGEPAKPEPAPGMGNLENLTMALTLAKTILTPAFAWWPEFDQVWSEHQVQQIAAGGAAVCDKHGWDFGGAIGAYAPYIALAVATAPPVIATARAIGHAKAEAAEAARAKSEGRAAAPAAP